jgi:enoyl-CoA hydratase/carnithine racemase
MSVAVSRRADGVVTLTLGEVGTLNIVGSARLEALAAAIRDLGEARVVVLRGAGERAFIGGADIREMAALAGPADAEAFIRRIHRVCAAIRTCPVPVIARIEGWCLGAGLEIAAACDLRLAGEGARFAMPEVRVGIPSVVEAALLPALIGWGRTRRLLLLGETLDAAMALGRGLVERVAPAGLLDAAVEEWVGMALQGGAGAMTAQKRLIAAWEGLPLAEAIAAGIPAFAAAFVGDDPRSMMRKFLDRLRNTESISKT